MKFIDFFAGVGGFRRGLEIAGHECVGFCEWDKYATASYTSMHLITDEQRNYLKTLSLNKRRREILEDEYRNGEWYANDIRAVDARSLPEADCWCFGAPCQDFSIAGKRAGLGGDRSSLVREIFRLLEEQKEQNRPEWLIYENVKGMLSSNKGLDYLSILSEMDKLGYDIEWQNINSEWFIPQNRERIYTVGHLRKYGCKKILPISTADRENSAKKIEKSIKKESGTKKILTSFCDLNYGAGINLTESARTLQARYYKGATKFKGGTTGVAIGFIDPQERRKKKVEPKEVCPTLRSETHGNVPEVTIKVREATKKGYTEAKQGDSINFSMPNSKTRRGRVGHGVAQTLDTSCNQGIFVQVNEDFAIYAIWYEKYNCYIAIRKLTPRECFRLQGWTDEYYNRAEFVNTDTQLYKQAGNGVTVNVITEIGKKIR